MPETINRVRHAVSRSTGATTSTRKDGDEWSTTCLNHGAETTATARGAAWKNSSTPANFCPKCRAIVAGKAAKTTGDRLDLPTAKARREEAAHPQGDGCRSEDRCRQGRPEEGNQVTKPEDACGRWPECRCRESCDYWSGDFIRPVEDDPDN